MLVDSLAPLGSLTPPGPWSKTGPALPVFPGFQPKPSRFASNGSDPSPFVHHHEIDIRDRAGVLALLKTLRPDAIVHTAAQPSHDRAAAIHSDDFDTNAVSTLNLLEAAPVGVPLLSGISIPTAFRRTKTNGDGRKPFEAFRKEWGVTLQQRGDAESTFQEHPKIFVLFVIFVANLLLLLKSQVSCL